MGESRRQYDEEFKRNAVELSYRSVKNINQVAADLGINRSMLARWRKELIEYGERAFPGTGKLRRGTNLEEENRRPQKDLAIVREERNILKKASVPRGLWAGRCRKGTGHRSTCNDLLWG